MKKTFPEIEEIYKDLVVKAISDTITATESGALKSWLEEDPDHKSYFSQMKNTWLVSSSVGKSDVFSNDAGWENMKSKMNLQKKMIDFSRLLKIASVLVLTFSIGASVTYFSFKKSIKTASVAQNSTNMVIAPMGSKSELILPDSTRVWLNAGSKLYYSQSYNSNHRDVYLEGEAFFRVKKNPGKPFVVRTSHINVKAYGTEFNVKAYPEENTITTTLVSGNVKIQNTESNFKKFEISLKPNQKLTYVKQMNPSEISSADIPKNSSGLPSSGIKNKSAADEVLLDKDVETTLYTSWKDERWIIQREDLDKLIVKLERRYNVTFLYKPELLKNYKITGTIRKETLEQVLDLLKLTVPLKYNIKDGIVTLSLDRTRMENYLKVMH